MRPKARLESRRFGKPGGEHYWATGRKGDSKCHKGLGLEYQNALSGLWNGYHAYGCGTPTRWQKLDPGQSVTVRFSPPADDGGWVVGVYIATVYYSTDPQSAPSAYVTSPGFQVV